MLRDPNYRHPIRALLVALALALATVASIDADCLAAGKGGKSGKGGGKGGGGRASLVGTEGTVELGLRGLVDLDDDDETAAYADLTLGYFILEGFELGLSVLHGTTQHGQRDTFGVFFEYDWLTGTRFIPFGGIGLKHAAPPRGEAENDAKIGVVYIGLNLAVGPAAAFYGALQWEMADQPVLGPEGGRKKRNRDLNLGFRLYF